MTSCQLRRPSFASSQPRRTGEAQDYVAAATTWRLHLGRNGDGQHMAVEAAYSADFFEDVREICGLCGLVWTICSGRFGIDPGLLFSPGAVTRRVPTSGGSRRSQLGWPLLMH